MLLMNIGKLGKQNRWIQKVFEWVRLMVRQGHRALPSISVYRLNLQLGFVYLQDV